MAGGLFELRKDSITGWWVAVVVDREFDRSASTSRRSTAATPRRTAPTAPRRGGDGVRVRMLKPDAFILAGTEREKREPRPTAASPSWACSATAGSWQTIVAPRGHHESLADTTPQIAFEMLARARDVARGRRDREKTEYLQVVQNYGRQAGALTDHLCFDFYDLPQIPHRIGEELGGAARYVIREGDLPVLSAGRDEVADPRPARVRGLGERLLRAVRVALAVRAVGRAAPPRRRLRHGHRRAAGQRRRDAAERPELLVDARRTRRTTSSCTRRRCTSASTRRTTGTGRSTRACARSPASSSARACPSTRFRPRRRRASCSTTARAEAIDTGVAVGPRSWDEFLSNDESARTSVTATPAVTASPPGKRRSARAHRPAWGNVRSRSAACSKPRSIGRHVTTDRATARAFVERLYAAHHAEIYAYLARMLRDDELAADLTQETFVKAYRAFDTLAGPQPRACLAVPDRRPHGARRAAPAQDRALRPVDRRDAAAVGLGPRTSCCARGCRPTSSARSPRIPPRQRQALLLAELHELTGLELADALGVSHVAARALLTRGRESLRQALAVERAKSALEEDKRVRVGRYRACGRASAHPSSQG